VTFILDIVKTRRHVLGTLIALCGAGRTAAQYTDLFAGWPGDFEGERLRRDPMTRLDQRLLKQFPGRFAHFRTDSAEVLFRWTPQSTRALRVSREVYAYNRFRLTPSSVTERPGSGPWLCFEAEKGLDRLRICEQITDAKGKRWSDFDSWYEEAVEARVTDPPWTAVTIIEPID